MTKFVLGSTLSLEERESAVCTAAQQFMESLAADRRDAYRLFIEDTLPSLLGRSVTTCDECAGYPHRPGCIARQRAARFALTKFVECLPLNGLALYRLNYLSDEMYIGVDGGLEYWENKLTIAAVIKIETAEELLEGAHDVHWYDGVYFELVKA